MVKTEQFTVGDHSYSVTQWNATKAMVMKLKLMKYLGGLMSTLDNPNGDISGNLMNSLGDILDGVNIEDFVGFIKEVACSAARGNDRMVISRFDEYFSGEIMEAYKVAFKVIEVNYKDFLVSVLSLRKGK